MHYDFTLNLTRDDRGDWHVTLFHETIHGLELIHTSTGDTAGHVLSDADHAASTYVAAGDLADELDAYHHPA